MGDVLFNCLFKEGGDMMGYTIQSSIQRRGKCDGVYGSIVCSERGEM